MGLARSVGGFAKQLAVAIAVGDVLSSNAENLALTPNQTKIRDYRNQTTGAAEAYVKEVEDKDPISGLLRFGGSVYNEVIDLFTLVML